MATMVEHIGVGPGDALPGDVLHAVLDARVAPLAASLAARLGAVCRDWEPAAFAALVDRIARTKLRWADRGYGD